MANIEYLRIALENYKIEDIIDHNNYIIAISVNYTLYGIDKIIYILLYEFKFSDYIFDFICKYICKNLNYITSIFINKFNIDNSSFMFNNIKDIEIFFHNSINYVYKNKKKEDRKDFIKFIIVSSWVQIDYSGV